MAKIDSERLIADILQMNGADRIKTDDMNYCNRKKEPTSTVQCLCCEHCLPPGERTEGRMCSDDVAMDFK